MSCQLPTDKVFAIPLLLFLCVCFSSPCLAGEVDADVFGLTAHLNPKGNVYNAPLKLDRTGSIVFNPGLGLGYDFRDDRNTEGFSAIVHGGLFENCDNHPFTFAGAGARYRKYFDKKNYYLSFIPKGSDGSITSTHPCCF